MNTTGFSSNQIRTFKPCETSGKHSAVSHPGDPLEKVISGLWGSGVREDCSLLISDYLSEMSTASVTSLVTVMPPHPFYLLSIESGYSVHFAGFLPSLLPVRLTVSSSLGRCRGG